MKDQASRAMAICDIINFNDERFFDKQLMQCKEMLQINREMNRIIQARVTHKTKTKEFRTEVEKNAAIPRNVYSFRPASFHHEKWLLND